MASNFHIVSIGHGHELKLVPVICQSNGLGNVLSFCGKANLWYAPAYCSHKAVSYSLIDKSQFLGLANLSHH